MPTWLKVVLILLLVGAIVLGAAVFFGIRWLKSQGGELREQGKAAMAEAEQFGRGREAKVCMSEAFTRLRACDGFICEAKVNVFLRGCLDAANVPPDFCTGVPPREEIMATARWTVAECAKYDLAGNQPCNRLVRAIQDYCHPK